MKILNNKKFVIQMRTVTVLLSMALSVLASAHEFWLQPTKFLYAVGETLSVSINVGSNFIAGAAGLKIEKIKKLQVHSLTSTTDLKPSQSTNQKEDFTFPLSSGGTHILVMETAAQISETNADQFNAYLKDEGLDDAAFKRKSNNELTKSGIENSVRYTKLIIQVGATHDDTYKKVLGLPIEIIPEKNPYTVKVGDLLKFKILSGGKPLFGVKVKVWNRDNNRTIIQPAYTLQDGTIEARISSKGPWMVSVIKIAPSKDKTADWQTYKGTLVFGIL